MKHLRGLKSSWIISECGSNPWISFLKIQRQRFLKRHWAFSRDLQKEDTSGKNDQSKQPFGCGGIGLSLQFARIICRHSLSTDSHKAWRLISSVITLGSSEVGSKKGTQRAASVGIASSFAVFTSIFITYSLSLCRAQYERENLNFGAAAWRRGAWERAASVLIKALFASLSVVIFHLKFCPDGLQPHLGADGGHKQVRIVCFDSR